MSELMIMAIAVGLAMDAFAVSIASGVAIEKMHLKHAMLIASFFGVFQAVMPVLGWLGGSFAANWLAAYDHWIAFGLLFLVGAKMIYESFQIRDDKKKDPLNNFVLLVLAVATSIDAFAVGLSFALLKVPVLLRSEERRVGKECRSRWSPYH